MKGNYTTLENELISIAKTGSGDAKILAQRQATAIANYIESVKFTVPIGSFVDKVTGQAVGTSNILPVEVDKE